MKKQKGITLIALVITIIVLLILAGISISLVMGENGVLNQAKNAVDKNNEARVKEEISMAWASLETDYVTKLYTSQRTPKSEIFTKENLDRELEGKGTVSDLVFNEKEDSTLKYTTTDGVTYNMVIAKDGNVEIAETNVE